MNQKRSLATQALKLGIESQKQGLYAQAEKLYLKTINLDPSYIEGFNCLGALALDLGKSEKAEEIYRAGISHSTPNALTFFGLGESYRNRGMLEDSLTLYLKADEYKHSFSGIYNNIALVYGELGKHKKAIEYCEKAISHKPDFPEAYNNLGYSYRYIGEIEKALRAHQKAFELKPTYFDAYSNYLFTLAQDPNTSFSDYYVAACEYNNKVSEGVEQYIHWEASREKLKVGFISGDFKNHVISKLLLDPLRALSTLDIELVAFNNSEKFDDVSKEIKQCFHNWFDVSKHDDKQLSELIHKQNLNILVDLSGHSGRNRLPVLAYKPAPIQISWLGFFASTGLRTVDYFVSSPFCAAGLEKNFTEKIAYIESFQCLREPNIQISKRQLSPFNDNGYITFGYFNRVDKINDKLLEVWSSILEEVSGSKIYFNSWLFKDQEFCNDFYTRLSGFGITEDRVTLDFHDGKYESYLSCFNRVDLVLDSFPYNGSTVNLECLWMNVPYISLAGDTIISRTGASILNSLKLQDLIAASELEYKKLAVSYALEPHRIDEIRESLPALRAESGFYNAEIMAEDVFSCFQVLWERYSSK